MVLTGLEILGVVQFAGDTILFVIKAARKLHEFIKDDQRAGSDLLSLANSFECFEARLQYWYKDTWQLAESKQSNELGRAYWGEGFRRILQQLVDIRDMCSDLAAILANTADIKILNQLGKERLDVLLKDTRNNTSMTSQKPPPSTLAMQTLRKELATEARKNMSQTQRIKFVISRHEILKSQLHELNERYSLLCQDSDTYFRGRHGGEVFNKLPRLRMETVQNELFMKKISSLNRTSDLIYAACKQLEKSPSRRIATGTALTLEADLNPRSECLRPYHVALPPPPDCQDWQELLVQEIENLDAKVFESSNFTDACARLLKLQGTRCEFPVPISEGSKAAKRYFRAWTPHARIRLDPGGLVHFMDLHKLFQRFQSFDRTDKIKLSFRIVSAGFLLLGSPWAAHLDSRSLFWLKRKQRTTDPSPGQHLLLEVGSPRFHEVKDVEPQLFSLGVLLAEVALFSPILAFQHDPSQKHSKFELKTSVHSSCETTWVSSPELLGKTNQLGRRMKTAVAFCLQQTDPFRDRGWSDLAGESFQFQQAQREKMLREYALHVYGPLEELHQETCQGVSAEAGFLCF